MRTLGIDVGYYSTKVTSRTGNDIFVSTVSEGIFDINNTAIKVEFEGNEYTIGEKSGSFSVSLNKIEDFTFRLCLFTAIARQLKYSSEKEIVNIVTGLPVQYYSNQKKELAASLEGKKVTIVLNEKAIHFEINKCLVFPQSAGLFILRPNEFKGSTIVIDIGGMTVDASYFQGITLDKSKVKTYELGMLKLYDNIVQEIKSKYNVSFDTLSVEEIIGSKSFIKDGEIIDCTDLINKQLKAHTRNIIMNVTLGIKEYDTSRRFFVGGGSYILKDYLPGEVNKNDIFINSEAFYAIGVNKFEK